MVERLDDQMIQMKSEINQSQLSDKRAEKDIHEIAGDVFRLDELSWGNIGICIAQLLFGCVNVYAWRRRPFQVELENLPRPADEPRLVTSVPSPRSLSRRSRRSYSEYQGR